MYTKEKKICAKQVLNMKKIGTVFIADDESIIRDGLKCILDWESLGFEICGEAANGEDTLQAILTLKPSLVLLDIRMPKMHGLEIVKAAREKKYKGKFVILSGYSDFKYAQEAIKYGVDFYLTKPIDEDELFHAIDTVRNSILKEQADFSNIRQYRSKAKNVILFDLVTNSPDIANLDFTDMNFEADHYQIVLYENFALGQSDLLYNFSDLLKVTNQGNHSFETFKIAEKHVILLKGSFALGKFNEFLRHYDDRIQKGSPLDSLFICYGRPVDNLFDVHYSYEDALRLMSRRFFCDQGQHTLGYEDLPNLQEKTKEIGDDMIRDYCDQLVDYLQSFNRKKVAEILYHLEQYLYHVKEDLESIKLFLADLYLQIKDKIGHIYSTMNINFPSNAVVIETIHQKNYLYEIILFFSEQFDMIISSIGNSSRDSVLDDIIYYIDHNYTSNLKLETIAPLFGYNSAYLGKIFNKTVGESFNSYVDHVRINFSKELLKENKLKVYEIAEQVGYKNVDYFHKKFKKYVGESPAEYRKQLELDED